MPTTLPSVQTLLIASWAHLRRFIVPIAAGAVLFGLLAGTASFLLERQIALAQREEWLSLGQDQNEFENLMRRIETGDEEAFSKFLRNQQLFLDRLDQMSEGEQHMLAAEQTWRTFRAVLPILGWLLIMQLIVAIVSGSYFILQAVEKQATIGALVQRLQTTLGPLAGLSVWLFARSFVWVPLVGPFLALYFGPRLLLAPVILLREKTGISRSAQLSVDRTANLWIPILGRVLAMAVLVILAVAVLAGIPGAINVIPVPLMTVLSFVIMQLGVAFGAIYTVTLATAMMPKKK
jgi:hypothetical protein